MYCLNVRDGERVMVSWDIHKLFKRVSAIFTAGVIGLTCGIPAAHAEEQYPDVMFWEYSPTAKQTERTRSTCRMTDTISRR